ncbi:phage major capsid protein [Mesorhizobium sp. CAU 1741]|uniref:phage major capsid protein n=1 Tax=Mesorhizobium sp. CAU 1741 TaxID=3140366 RepID=UPI00325A8546
MRAAIATATRGEPGLMASYVRHLALANGRPSQAASIAEDARCSDRVVGALKAAVPAHRITDSDLAGLRDANYVSAQFVPFLARASVFYYLIEQGGMIRVPLEQRIGWTTATATAYVAREGAAVPVSRVAVDGTGIERQKVNGLLVLTEDMVRNMGVRGETLISRELRRALANTVDEAFLDAVVDSSTAPLDSTGNPAQDLAALLAAVEPTIESRLVWAMSPDVAIMASTVTTAAGGFLFPDMGPSGGEMLQTPAMAIDALPEGTIMLIDASGLAGDAELITVDASNETTIEMLDDPIGDATTPTAAQMVSMFQTNSVAMMSTAWFGVHRFRDEAIATMSGVEWGLPASGE